MKTKKYKLIKEFPGSPKLGTIFYGDITANPADYPEFWEEVVEKDYRIMKLRNSYQEIRVSDDEKVQFGGYTRTLEEAFKGGYFIHSVKRLSDGEVFTIGDKVIFNSYGYIIERIYTLEDGIRFYVGNGLNLGINNIEQIKKPLFTTEDGVDIFEDDIVQVVHLTSYFITHDVRITKTNYRTHYREGTKVFSTKEAAKEYILMNKPCLSFNEIKSAIWSGHDVSRIKKLIKSKCGDL